MTTTQPATQPIDLDAIRQRTAAASVGPWVATDRYPHLALQGEDLMVSTNLAGNPEADAQFIAHARADVPALIAEVERLRATHEPRRGSDIEAWIKAERDKYAEGDPVWTGLDYLLDDYREHADTGTPLDREVVGPTGGYITDPAA